MNASDAARLLGAAEREVLWAEDSPAGTTVKMFDGSSYVIVPDDQPDGEGKTGVMFLSAPTESYVGSFPVYVAPVDAETPLPPADAVYGHLSKDELLAIAADRGLKIDGRPNADKIIALLEDSDEAANVDAGVRS